MNKFLVLALSLMSFSANAEVYECTNGSFSSKPCAQTRTAADLIKENKVREQEKMNAQQIINSTEGRSKSVAVDFTSCKATVKKLQLAIASKYQYKTNVLHDTQQMYVARVCTYDGSVVITCNAVDKKLIATESGYCS